ncbi:MAG: hypothetical protein HKN92_05660 [Chitinophagales bacterium]|nr:hypothetical protein [Chitinophagales bacterium]
MHELEPYYKWRELYISSEDDQSPFFGKEYSEFAYSSAIYNYYIHPQWDFFGSPTMYIKILYADYRKGFVVIEMIGEWNDAINNDIMFLKREVIDVLVGNGINKFILIGENILNFHASDDCYYEEWHDDLSDEGWIVGLNFREHVVNEMQAHNVHHYIHCNKRYQDLAWRKLQPEHLLHATENLIFKFIG